jgi:hypothetical protein
MERDDMSVIFGGSKSMRGGNHDLLKCCALPYHVKNIQNKFFVVVEVYKIDIRFHTFFVVYISLNYGFCDKVCHV